MKPNMLLWAGIFTGPVAWFINLNANFALAPLACTGGNKVPLFLVSGITLALAFLACGVSFLEWQRQSRDDAGEVVASDTRRRAMGMAGMAISGLSLLVIAAQAIPNLILGGCE